MPTLPISVPYTFGSQTNPIPLSYLDSDFSTITLAVNGIGSGTTALANVNITGGNSVVYTSNASYYSANGVITTSVPDGAYSYGTLNYSDTNIFASYQTSANSYSQVIVQNTSSGTTASSNFIVSNDLGTATTYFGEFGINSSGFTGSGSLALGNAVYMTATSGDLVVGTTTANSVRFVTNSSTTDAITINSSGQVTIPNLLTSYPAFAASIGSIQLPSSGTITKVQFNVEVFDTNSNYDTTNYRFTPTVAGYYQVNGIVRGTASTTFTSMRLFIYKNGSAYKTSQLYTTYTPSISSSIQIADIVYMNGSSDYLEIYCSISGTGVIQIDASTQSTFSSCLLRGA